MRALCCRHARMAEVALSCMSAGPCIEIDMQMRPPSMAVKALRHVVLRGPWMMTDPDPLGVRARSTLALLPVDRMELKAMPTPWVAIAALKAAMMVLPVLSQLSTETSCSIPGVDW